MMPLEALLTGTLKTLGDLIGELTDTFTSLLLKKMEPESVDANLILLILLPENNKFNNEINFFFY